MTNSVEPNEVAHYEPPHLSLFANSTIFVLGLIALSKAKIVYNGLSECNRVK